MSSKQDIIPKAYFDRAGFQSKSNTLKDAREKDKSITVADVNEFFKENVEEKRKPRGENSFVAPHSFLSSSLICFLLVKAILTMNRNLELDLCLPIYLVSILL